MADRWVPKFGTHFFFPVVYSTLFRIERLLRCCKNVSLCQKASILSLSPSFFAKFLITSSEKSKSSRTLSYSQLYTVEIVVIQTPHVRLRDFLNFKPIASQNHATLHLAELTITFYNMLWLHIKMRKNSINLQNGVTCGTFWKIIWRLFWVSIQKPPTFFYRLLPSLVLSVT